MLNDRFEVVERLRRVSAAHYKTLAETQPAVGHLAEKPLIDRRYA